MLSQIQDRNKNTFLNVKMAMCDVFMSNLNIILNKVDELAEIRDKVNKVKKNSGPGLLGDILDTGYVKDLLKDLDARAKIKIEEFREFKHDKEQEMQEDFLEVDDQNVLDTIINGQKEAESIVKEIEELLSPNREVNQQEDITARVSEAGDVADRDCEPEGVAVTDVEAEDVLESVPNVPGPSSVGKSGTSSKVSEHQYSKGNKIRSKKPQCPRDVNQWYHDNS